MSDGLHTFTYKVKCTNYYYGYPQAERDIEIDCGMFAIYLKHYGNQGYDIPEVSQKRSNNGYFWMLNAFMRAFYGTSLRDYLHLREGDVYKLTIDDRDVSNYKLEKEE